MTFEEKVKSMTAKEIIMAMVNGLKAEHVKVDMRVFGYAINGVCYGCAATNAICEISGKVFTTPAIYQEDTRADFLHCNPGFLTEFETAIDFLRNGWAHKYNGIAKRLGIAEIFWENTITPYLPGLENYNYLENLHFYEDLAEAQTP